MTKGDRPLTEDERQEVAGYITDALRVTGLSMGEAAPDRIQVVIRETIDLFRSLQESDRAAVLDDAALRLGCLWGQSVCDRLGWEWASVRLGREWEDYGVVTPGRSHVIFPVRYIRELLADPERDPTSLALYNMLKVGSLPPAEPGSYQVLS
jgi:hypothetical protein